MTSTGQPETLQIPEGYEAFFGLREPPFSLAADPRFLFASASHSAALGQVAYAIQRREPLVVVTGDIGTGKTLVCRTMLQRLPGKTFLSVINDPLLERDDLLKQLLEDFGVIPKDRTRIGRPSRHELVQALHAFLSSIVPLESHAVVIIDEAQYLTPDVLEQIRLLSNIGDDRGTALGIVLVGQSGLDELLVRPDLRQLQQRVSRWLQLTALSRDEVGQYIEHRLSVARDSEAGSDRIVEFASDAIDAVSELSRGIPRVINLLCDRALEDAFRSKLRAVDRRLIDNAALELGLGDDQLIAEPASTEPSANLHLVDRGQKSAGDDNRLIRAIDKQSAERDRELSFGRADQRSTEHTHEAAVEGSDEPSFAHTDHASLERAAAEIDAAHPPTRPALVRYAVLALLTAALGAAVFFGIQRMTPSPEPPAAAPAASRPPARLPASAPSSPSASTGDAASPADAASQTASPAAGSTPAAAPAAAPTSTAPPPSAPARAAVAPAPNGRFEIIVASFRTDARATAVAAEVTALGLPIRRRATDSWQQVLAGPFATRADAEVAQDRLDNAGITGTQVVETAR